jgi:hypothetical protein
VHLFSGAWVVVGLATETVVGAVFHGLRPVMRKQDLGAVSAGWIAEHNARKSDGEA